jgi:phosphoglycerate dehydrogenase-like enzyme
MIGEEEIGLMKEGVRLINCARENLDEKALLGGLGEEDAVPAWMYSKEPPKANDPAAPLPR